MKTSARPQLKPVNIVESQAEKEARELAEREQRWDEVEETRNAVEQLVSRVRTLTKEQLVQVAAILTEEVLNDAQISLLYGRPQKQDPRDDKIKNQNQVVRFNKTGDLNVETPALLRAIAEKTVRIKDFPLFMKFWEDGIFKGSRSALKERSTWISENIEKLDLSKEADYKIAVSVLNLTTYRAKFERDVRDRVTATMSVFIKKQLTTNTRQSV